MSEAGRWLVALAPLLSCGSCVEPEPSRGPSEGLLPRSVILAPADMREAPQISPDGTYISFLAAVNGVRNVWVAPAFAADLAEPVTHATRRGIGSYQWAHAPGTIVFLQDNDGDENWRVRVVDVTAKTERDLTTEPRVQARIEGTSPARPDEIVVGLNARDSRFHDLYRVHLTTGARELIWQNDGFLSWAIDDQLDVRVGLKAGAGGSMVVHTRAARTDALRPAFEIPFADTLTTALLGIDGKGQTAYFADSRDRDTAALVAIHLATGKRVALASDPKADVRRILQHPRDRHVEAAVSTYERPQWHFLDTEIDRDLRLARQTIGDAESDIDLVSRTTADTKWIVASRRSDRPTAYFLFDRQAHALTPLFGSARQLMRLPAMHSVRIPARDGLELVSYLTMPTTATTGPAPLVLLVHGGPWSRDEWGWNPTHQWLANRGYAVMSVNFRGSLGFGKTFLNAGNGEWGRKMNDDLVDAVQWAVSHGIADPSRVAIMGASYGGYAALVGMTTEPNNPFACGVDAVGPSNLVSFLESIPAYWDGEVEQNTRRIGDHRTKEGRAFLLSRSPLSRVDRIRRPILIGQGANDARVNARESDQIVQAMKASGSPVTYAFFPDEGHGFGRTPNFLSWSGLVELFLARCVGGRAEPVDFAGSSIVIREGVQHIPGLTNMLGGR